jgi:methionyl-tRNA formyltransferase
MRIAFFGLPLAAVLLARDGHEIPIAVLSRENAPGARRIARLIGRSRVAAKGTMGDRELLDALAGAHPDLLVSWFWTAKLPAAFVRAARLGGVGAHPSLLPRHRGPDPYFAAIDCGDRDTGVSIHRIDREYDTGSVLAQTVVAIDPRWNAWQLARALDRPSLALLRETVSRLARGETIAERPQDESFATWAPMPSLADCALTWRWPTEKIVRRVRALAPAPGAFTELGGLFLTVLRVRASERYPGVLAPGEAAVVDGIAVVRTGDGAVDLLSGEINGEVLDAAGLCSIVARSRDKVVG